VRAGGKGRAVVVLEELREEVFRRHTIKCGTCTTNDTGATGRAFLISQLFYSPCRRAVRSAICPDGAAERWTLVEVDSVSIAC
jgi:hypothetical protein